MALMRKCIVTKPSSFQEVVQQPIWVDAMVEKHDSIFKNNAWEIVPTGQQINGWIEMDLQGKASY